MNANLHRKSMIVLSAGLIVGALALSRLSADDDTVPPVTSATLQNGSRHVRSNVYPVSDALDTIERIRGVGFDVITDYGITRRFGLIAEDLPAAIPELMRMDENVQTGDVDNTAVLSLAVESIRALRAENAALRAENAWLRGQVSLLQARMERIEQALRESPRCGTNETSKLED